MPFEIPSRIQSRLDRKAAPTRKQAQPLAEASFEIIPIAEWAEYRAAHPELEFTGKFDLQGRPLWTPQSPEPFTERQSR